MHSGKLVFAQVMECVSWHTFHRLIAKCLGDFNIRTFGCLNQFICITFAHLASRPTKLFHLSFRGKVSRRPLCNANESHD